MVAFPEADAIVLLSHPHSLNKYLSACYVSGVPTNWRLGSEQNRQNSCPWSLHSGGERQQIEEQVKLATSAVCVGLKCASGFSVKQGKQPWQCWEAGYSFK